MPASNHSEESPEDFFDAYKAYDWRRVAYLVLASRALDHLEETVLVPQKEVLYQFSARGHDLAQILLGLRLNHRHDAAAGYYRSRPLLLSLGLTLEDALSAPLARSGGFSDGRDIGVVCNLPESDGAIVLPMSGSVGSQYTPSSGWAQAVVYRHKELGDPEYKGAIAAVLGGDASVATNGFWSALTMATTLKLPQLFYIEDNGYGISVPTEFQTPGGDITENLKSFRNLEIFSGDGTQPEQAADLIHQAISHVRSWQGPALLKLEVPRLSGHSGQDTQAYKSEQTIADEIAQDPLPKLKAFMVPRLLSESDWAALERDVEADVTAALAAARSRPQPDPTTVARHVYCEADASGQFDFQIRGGVAPEGHVFPESTRVPHPEPSRINMLTAIRRTLECELRTNPKLVVFGEDVGPKGGVHAATLGLQKTFGEDRVFDTSLSEEGIIGRAIGMAIAGLMPVPEIQFRKYADPATEQLNDCGTIRWRTANRFAAPMVVRIPGGFAKCGDPWHSACNEVMWAHTYGWQVAIPSNAQDAVGLLRTAMRSHNPTIFFEHRALLDGSEARGPYPGDAFVVPFGQARTVCSGDELTVITWGAMVSRCYAAAQGIDAGIEVLDLRTIMPWDKETILESVEKTGRCLIVHEDNLTAGFGAEIAAWLAKHAFFSLDAPIERLTMPDVPSPHNVVLLQATVPSIQQIEDTMVTILET